MSSCKRVRLDQITRVVGGSTPASSVDAYWNGDILWITPTDLGALTDTFITGSARRITKAGYASCGTELVPPGSVVLSSRAPIGHLAIAAAPLCTNQGCKTFVPGSEVDSAFLYYCLRNSVGKLRALGSGATFSEVSKSQVESFEIELPPLAEQRRIAARLTEQLAAEERARKAAEERVEAARGLARSTLAETFSHSARAAWRESPLGEEAVIVSGVTLGRRLNGVELRQVPYLRVANVKDGHLDLSDVKTTPATAEEIAELRLRKGDLLLTEGGDPDKLGRGTVWRDELPLCIHQNHIFRVRFDRTRFAPDYVSMQIGSPYGKAYFLLHAKQTTGIATINRKVLGAFPLLAPSIAEQERLVEAVTQRLRIAASVTASAEAELAAIEALPAALLREAFAWTQGNDDSGEPGVR